MGMEILEREVSQHTVETVLLLGCIALITFAKISYEIRFQRFLGAYVSDKYLKLYGREQEPNINKFNILLFVVQLVIFGMLLDYSLEYFGMELRRIDVLLVIVCLGLFVMFKFYLEKIIATVFDLVYFLEQYNFYKLTYRNLAAVILLPFIALLIYNPSGKKVVIFVTIGLFLLLNCIAWVRILKKNQKLLFKKLFYFILYLCALEIAPYLIVARVVFFK